MPKQPKTKPVFSRSEDKAVYEDSGFCSLCLLTLEALTPGGTEVRHKSNKVPYGECAQAIRAKELAAKPKALEG